MKIAVVSPHRGDAAFALALTIGTWIEAGHKVVVLNCFSRSESAPYAEMDFVHSNDRMSFVTALRGREDEVWRRQYGSALTLVDLNMKEAPLRLHVPASEVYRLAVNPADKALEKIRKAVEKVGAGAVVVPMGVGGHIDHLTAREAMAGTVASAAVAFYEDMPYAAEALDLEGFAVEVGLQMGAGLSAGFAGAETDIEGTVKRKRRAVFCYDSQVEDAKVELISRFCAKYGGRERLWGNAGWQIQVR